MRKFGRKKSNREHLIRNLLTSLVLYERIDTTVAKGKEIKTAFDRLIARNKSADFNAVRRLQKILFDRNAVKKTVKELLPRYSERTSGFVRSYRLENRLGDSAEMIRLELVDRKVFAKEAKAQTEVAPSGKNLNKIVKNKEKNDDKKE